MNTFLTILCALLFYDCLKFLFRVATQVAIALFARPKEECEWEREWRRRVNEARARANQQKLDDEYQ